MAHQKRPKRLVRSKPITHTDVLKELKDRQKARILASIPIPEVPKPSIPIPEVIKAKAAEVAKSPPVPSKKLCIGTIFIDCGPLGEQWLDLQLKYIKATTRDFHHISVVHNGKITPFFENNTQVIRPGGKGVKNSKGHVIGLECLHRFFIKRRELYEDFLFIDMDAFPIKNNWHNILKPRVSGAAKNSPYEIATLLRCENLEQRLHSSVLFTGQTGLDHLKWGVQKVGMDLIGKQESDVKIVNYQEARRNKAFVMLRSNQHQIHPLLCGVYYDLFYHHGCGSGRNYNMRSKPYWSHIVPQAFDVRASIDQLMENPNEFIGKLAGWNQDQYPQV